MAIKLKWSEQEVNEKDEDVEWNYPVFVCLTEDHGEAFGGQYAKIILATKDNDSHPNGFDGVVLKGGDSWTPNGTMGVGWSKNAYKPIPENVSLTFIFSNGSLK